MTYVAGPYNGKHIYIQWGGKLPGGDEWSNGLRMAPAPGVSSPVYDAGMHTAVVSAVDLFHRNPLANISPRCKLSFVKMNVINTAGHYDEPVTHETVLADFDGSGTASLTPPNQVALAISLTTGVSRGPAHRGRFYMPLPCIAVAADGLISDAARNDVKTAATSFIAALNAITVNFDVAVMSRKLGAPSSRTVTGIEIGRVLDTQRRRRQKLNEAY